MRRFVTVLALLLFTIPFGISLTGCSKKAAVVYCNGGDTGLTVGQLQTITLQPQLYGVSLNENQMGQVTAPTATDCKGNSVSVTSYTYATSNMNIADINPTTGALCGGNWNRNTPGGIANYTTCATTATTTTGIAYITATRQRCLQQRHPGLRAPHRHQHRARGALDQLRHRPCHQLQPGLGQLHPRHQRRHRLPHRRPHAQPTAAAPPRPTPSSASPPPPPTPAPAASRRPRPDSSPPAPTPAPEAPRPTSAARSDRSPTPPRPPPSSPSTRTASPPPSSPAPPSSPPPWPRPEAPPATSPPARRSTSPSPTPTPAPEPPTWSVDPNYTQPVTAVAKDKNGQILNGLTLEYTSTTPIPIPAASAGTITPVYPGEAAITAVCQPPSCNPAPYSEIGIYGNGVPVSSHSLTVTTPGTNSTDLYIASTQSRYLVPVDFTQTTLGAPILLPYAPNSMAISNDGTTIYLGSSTELMVLATATGTITTQNTADSGYVLGVSPNNSTVVIADPVRKQIYLYTASRDHRHRTPPPPPPAEPSPAPTASPPPTTATTTCRPTPPGAPIARPSTSPSAIRSWSTPSRPAGTASR